MTEAAQSKTFEEQCREQSARYGTKEPGHVPPILLKATPERLHLNAAGHVFQQFVYAVPVGTEPLLVLSPTYWVPVHQRLMPHDKIRAISDAGDWEGEIVVRTVDPMRVDVDRIYLHAFEVLAGPRGGPTLKNAIGAQVIYRGLQEKWCVVAGANLLRGGFASFAQASQWLANHLRTMEASA